mgnify:CR=1 FL=1
MIRLAEADDGRGHRRVAQDKADGRLLEALAGGQGGRQFGGTPGIPLVEVHRKETGRVRVGCRGQAQPRGRTAAAPPLVFGVGRAEDGQRLACSGGIGQSDAC